MQLIQSVTALQRRLRDYADETIGLVPTMGALHAGHLSLIDRCRQECDVTVVSVFVNPLQFGPQEDFSRYPRTLDADCKQCEQAGVDIVFAPEVTELLGQDPTVARIQVIPPAALLTHLCGPFRPGHFEGVLTIVATLFHIAQPQRAYFGQKDAQQLILIQQMVRDLKFPIDVIPCSTVREPSGLALSSRNQYLSSDERHQASILFKSLLRGKRHLLTGDCGVERILSAARDVLKYAPEIQIQYLELVDLDTLQPITTLDPRGLLAIAAYIGDTRLIDNLILSRPIVREDGSVRRPLIAIDGPAGAGKSTVAREVAAELSLLYLDTGAMYRALTWLALQQGIPVDDESTLAATAHQAELKLNTLANTPTRVWVNEQEVTDEIRSSYVTEKVSAVSAHAQVRQAMMEQQRSIGYQGGVVLEGRDIGTYVFPDAELKIFLTASTTERAQRRLRQLEARGESVGFQELTQQIEDRDRFDSQRPIAPLRQAPDAIVINTDNITATQVKEQIKDLYKQLQSD